MFPASFLYYIFDGMGVLRSLWIVWKDRNVRFAGTVPKFGTIFPFQVDLIY